MTTIEEASRLLLQRGVQAKNAAVTIDLWDPTDADDEPSATVVYARDMRHWIDPATGLLRVEATLDVPAGVNVDIVTPLYGNRVAITEWVLTSADPFSGLRGTVTATGWVPEVLEHPLSRRASSWEAPGQVVGAVSAVLSGTPGPWTAGFAGIRITAEPVQSTPGHYRIRASVAGTPISASALLAALTPGVSVLSAINVGTLAAAAPLDTNTVTLVFA